MIQEHKADPAPIKFQAIHQQEVPKGREGKHKLLVTQILNEVERLDSGAALKVPLSALPDTKENIRAALNRATRQKGMHIATSSDSGHLYIWRIAHRP